MNTSLDDRLNQILPRIASEAFQAAYSDDADRSFRAKPITCSS